jgi:hypothetical protein
LFLTVCYVYVEGTINQYEVNQPSYDHENVNLIAKLS